MNLLREYDVEFVKLKDGLHSFEFNLEDSFFKAFNSSLLVDHIKVHLDFIKSPSMFTLTFRIDGDLKSECDRCLNDISLPVHGQYVLLVKITEQELEDQDDLIYINSAAHKINVSQPIFDYIHLLLPIKKTCTDVGLKCNPEIAGKITMLIDVDTVGDDIPDRDTDDEEEE